MSSFEDVNHNTASYKLQRTQPFIIKFRQEYFVMVDKMPLVVKPSTMAVAVDVLLKTFFVFNVHFARQSLVALTLLQHTVLGIDGSLSAKAMKLLSEIGL